MTFAERTRTTVESMKHVVAQGIDRGTQLARRGTLEWQLDRAHAALGRAIYPLLLDGEIHTDLPQALGHVARIKLLMSQLSETRGESPDAADAPAKDDDEARWADEGGQHIG